MKVTQVYFSQCRMACLNMARCVPARAVQHMKTQIHPHCSFLLATNTKNIGLEAVRKSQSPVCPSTPIYGKIPAKGMLRPSVQHNICACKGANTAWHTPVNIKPAIKIMTVLHQRKTAKEIQPWLCACISTAFTKQFPRWSYQVNHIGGGKKKKSRKKKKEQNWVTLHHSYLSSTKKKKSYSLQVSTPVLSKPCK